MKMNFILKGSYLYSLILLIFIMMTSVPNGYRLTYPLAIMSLVLYLREYKFTIRNNRVFVWMFIFISLTFLYVFWGYGSFTEFRNVAWQYYIILLSCLLTPFIKFLKNEQLLFLKNIIIICVIVTIVGSIYVSSVDPMAIRNLGFGETGYENENQLASSYYRIGMVSYHLAHGLAVVPPILIFFIFERKSFIERIIYITLFILLEYVFFSSVITTSMLSSLVASMIIVVYYMIIKYEYSRFVFIFSLPLLFLCLDSSFLISIIEFFSRFAGRAMENKLLDIVNLLNGVQTSEIGYREKLHDMSINSFLNNPILGLASKEEIGSHSAFWDYLALYGIVGCFPLFLSIYYNINWQIQSISPFYKRIYLMCLIPYVILCYSKGAVFLGTYIFFASIVLPILFYWIVRDKFTKL